MSIISLNHDPKLSLWTSSITSENKSKLLKNKAYKCIFSYESKLNRWVPIQFKEVYLVYPKKKRVKFPFIKVHGISN